MSKFLILLCMHSVGLSYVNNNLRGLDFILIGLIEYSSDIFVVSKSNFYTFLISISICKM